jgi:hypothetical protein
MNLDKVIHYFNFKVVQIKQNAMYRLDPYGGMYGPAYYTYHKNNHDYDSTIEMEIGRRDLERLAEYFHTMEHLADQERTEFHLRQRYQGLQEAYDKYKTLVSLYHS